MALITRKSLALRRRAFGNSKKTRPSRLRKARLSGFKKRLRFENTALLSRARIAFKGNFTFPNFARIFEEGLTHKNPAVRQFYKNFLAVWEKDSVCREFEGKFKFKDQSEKSRFGVMYGGWFVYITSPIVKLLRNWKGNAIEARNYIEKYRGHVLSDINEISMSELASIRPEYSSRKRQLEFEEFARQKGLRL